MGTRHVFVSYAREDKEFARELNRRLRGSDVVPWQDVQNLRGGDSWQERIDHALRSASALVVIMSPHARKSEFVTYEWAFAIGAGVRVIPVIRSRTDLHPRLRALQFIDFTQRKPWVSLRAALPFVWRQRKVMPLIRARFMLDDQDPERRGSGYVVGVSVARVPRNTESVTYEIYDETAKLLKLTSTRSATNYASMFTTDGDVLVKATIRTTTKKLSVDTSLYAALRRTHARSLRKSVRAALRHFEEN